MELQDLQVGDKVLLKRDNCENVLLEVIYTTKTQIQTIFGKYRKKDGRKIGAVNLVDERIEIPTEEELAKIVKAEKREMMVRNLNNYDFSYLSDEKLEKFWKVMKEEIG